MPLSSLKYVGDRTQSLTHNYRQFILYAKFNREIAAAVAPITKYNKKGKQNVEITDASRRWHMSPDWCFYFLFLRIL